MRMHVEPLDSEQQAQHKALLRTSLASLKLGKLYKRALQEGVPEEVADEADNCEALIELIMELPAHH